MAARGLPRALVIGGQGVLGSRIAVALRESGFEVRRGGRRREAAADCVYVDLDHPETVERAIEHADLVVNTVLHPELTAERTVLERGGLLLSVASLSLADRVRLRSSEAREGLVVVHAGLNPGLMSLALAHLVAKHPDADTVEIAATAAPLQSMGSLAYEYVWPFLTSHAHRPTREIDFPQPLGRRRCILLGTGEEGWLGEIAGEGRRGRVWLTAHQRFFNGLLLFANRSGLLAVAPRQALSLLRPFTPEELPHDEKRDIAMVSREGRLLEGLSIRGDGDYRVSVACTVVFAEHLWRRRKEGELGVHGAETWFEFERLRPGFEARGIDFFSHGPGDSAADGAPLSPAVVGSV
jgi:hypothetical protein